jgi:hypothetical protein
MINFRFHLASLVAIFLALALGVVIGAGVIDRGVVDALDNRLNRVEEKADRIDAENERLRSDIAEKDEAISALSRQALGRQLLNADVGLVAVRGVDEERVALTSTVLTDAGANVTGVLWLERPWALEDREQISALAEAIGSNSRRPATLRSQAWGLLAARLTLSPTAVLAGPDGADDVVGALEAAGFVSFDAPSSGGDVTQFPGLAASLVLVVGSTADVPSADLVMPAATAINAEDIALVVADVYDPEAPDAGDRGGAFVDLRDSALSTKVSTVDDLDRTQGPPTVGLALTGLLQLPPVVGHYGLGPDTVLLPEPSLS